ncbi:MAG: DUF305 domain-containing protein [Chloroflexota bacterium]|nr:DUF305 domain-containing protein [Chloroflexota bacterium]MDQ6905732.1 DUF305 domain-containing protein [Chloroflexota bacterium]
MMTPHHQRATDTAEIELPQGQHPEPKNLATSVIADQQKEKDQRRPA